MITEWPLTPVTTLVGGHLMVGADALYDIGDDVQLHDLTVDDRVARKIFEAEADQVQVVELAFELDHLDRTGTDVQTGNAFLFTEHALFFAPLCLHASNFLRC